MKRWLHVSAMHPSNTEDKVIMSLMFRNCCGTAIVNRETHKVVLDESNLRQDIKEFDDMRETWMNDQKVIDDQVELMGKVQRHHDGHDEQQTLTEKTVQQHHTI